MTSSSTQDVVSGAHFKDLAIKLFGRTIPLPDSQISSAAAAALHNLVPISPQSLLGLFFSRRFVCVGHGGKLLKWVIALSYSYLFFFHCEAEENRGVSVPFVFPFFNCSFHWFHLGPCWVWFRFNSCNVFAALA